MRVCYPHSFDRFYIVTKFMLPSMGDIKFSKLNFDHTCTYMNKEYAPNMDSRKYLTELKTYCYKVKPFVSHYNNLIKSYNATIYNILESEIKPYYLNYPDRMWHNYCTRFRFHRLSL